MLEDTSTTAFVEDCQKIKKFFLSYCNPTLFCHITIPQFGKKFEDIVVQLTHLNLQVMISSLPTCNS